VAYRNPHSMRLKPGTMQKDTDGNTEFSKSYAWSPNNADDVAALNHYKFKSEEEFKHKSCYRMDVDRTDIHCTAKDLDVINPGDIFDDLAWQTLKSKEPKYAVYDQETTAEKYLE
jgi:hypothetical protein